MVHSTSGVAVAAPRSGARRSREGHAEVEKDRQLGRRELLPVLVIEIEVNLKLVEAYVVEAPNVGEIMFPGRDIEWRYGRRRGLLIFQMP